MACFRLKRLLNEDPAEAIVVSHKRRCIDVGGGDAFKEVQAIFRFAGTVRDKDECVTKILTKMVANEETNSLPIRRDVKTRPANVLARSKEHQKTISKENRFQLISAKRGITELGAADDVTANETASSMLEETVMGLCKLYDVEQYKEPKQKMKEPETITCNGIPLQRGEGSVPKSEDSGYVYDLYFAANDNLDNGLLHEPVGIEYCDVDEMGLYETDGDEDLFDEEDDSNDENNWRNDYPEDDDDFEKRYNFYERDEELLDRMAEFTIAGRASSEDDDLSSLEEQQERDSGDERLYGKSYATFKARMKAHLDEDVDDDQSPVLLPNRKDDLFR